MTLSHAGPIGRIIRAAQDVAGSKADIALAWILLAIWLHVSVGLYWDRFPPDFSALYLAGQFLASGRADLVYAAPPAFFGDVGPAWAAATEAIGGPTAVSYPFVYPPLWAALAAPLSERFDFFTVARTASIVQTALLALSVMISARLARPRGLPLSLWAALAVVALFSFEQPFNALLHNQPTLTAIFLVLLSLDRLIATRPGLAGTALAIAAAIKLWPVAFAVVFLVERQYRALAAFALAGLALALLSLITAGPELHWMFLDALHKVKSANIMAISNISLLSATATALEALDPASNIDLRAKLQVLYPLPGWLGPVVSASGLIATLACWRVIRREPWPARPVLAYFALSLIIPLFGPLGWQHYYLLTLLLLPFFLAHSSRPIAITVALVVLVLSPVALLDLFALTAWPSANYVWVLTAGWLGVLVAIPVGLRKR